MQKPYECDICGDVASYVEHDLDLCEACFTEPKLVRSYSVAEVKQTVTDLMAYLRKPLTGW